MTYVVCEEDTKQVANEELMSMGSDMFCCFFVFAAVIEVIVNETLPSIPCDWINYFKCEKIKS